MNKDDKQIEDAAPVDAPESNADASGVITDADQPQKTESVSGQGYQDKTLTCKDCSQEFVWAAGEQEYYSQKGFQHPPGRCRVCRAKYKAAREQFGRVESKIICKKCGTESTVPFVPRDANSVLCRDCYQKDRAGMGR